VGRDEWKIKKRSDREVPTAINNKPGHQSGDDRLPGGIFRISSVGLCGDFQAMNNAARKIDQEANLVGSTSKNFILPIR
jgi:hypothetical protein